MNSVVKVYIVGRGGT